MNDLPALRRQARGGRFVWALLTPCVLVGLSLATYAVAGRLLPPAEFGQFVVAIVVLTTVVPFVSLGAPVILVRHLAGAADHGAPTALRSAAYLTILIESGVIIALAALLEALPGNWLAQWLAPGMALVVAAGAGAAALIDLRVSEDQAAFKFENQFAGLAVAAVMRLSGVVAALLLTPGGGHRAAVAGYAAASVLSAVYLSRREVASAIRHGGRALSIRGDLARLGLPITASSILGVVTTQIDTLIAAASLGPIDLAQYAVANRLSLVHATAIGGLTAIALPVAATLAKQGGLERYARVTTRLGLAVGTAAVGLSIVLAPTAVAMLFGDAYLPSVMVFVTLSGGFLLNYAANPLSQILYMTHRGHLLVIVQLAQLLLFVALGGLAAARWGAIGLASVRTATNLAAVAVIGVASIVAARRHARERPAGPPA